MAERATLSVFQEIREAIEAMPRCDAIICNGGTECLPEGHAPHVSYVNRKWPEGKNRDSILFIEDIRSTLSRLEAKYAESE